MASKIWSGSINFGLVTIPVVLHSATQNHTIQFHQYQRGTSDRVRYERVNERTGKQLDYDDVVKGREVRGQLIIVEPEELDEIAPGRSRTIEIATFVDRDEIDPIYVHKTYWLAPTSREHARSYAVLRRALADRNKVGIASFVLRGRQYVSAIRADTDMLALDTLCYADEVRTPSQVSEPGHNRTRFARTSGAWPPRSSMRCPVHGNPRISATPTPSGWKTCSKVNDRAVSPRAKRRRLNRPTSWISRIHCVAAPSRLAAPASRSGHTSRRGSRSSQRQRNSRSDLYALTKSELGRLAREHGIRKRSTMRRAELEQAIANARKSSRKAS